MLLSVAQNNFKSVINNTKDNVERNNTEMDGAPALNSWKYS